MNFAKLGSAVSVILIVLTTVTAVWDRIPNSLGPVLIWLTFAVSLATSIVALAKEGKNGILAFVGGILVVVGGVTSAFSGPDGLNLWVPGVILLGGVLFLAQLFVRGHQNTDPQYKQPTTLNAEPSLRR